LHAVDIGEEAGGGETIVEGIGLDVPEMNNLPLEIVDSC
jgi:hypothetical protein